jgi:hypothetical protein
MGKEEGWKNPLGNGSVLATDESVRLADKVK